jgi:hypothetical protein
MVLQDMGKLDSDYCGKQFTRHVEEGYWAVGFRDGVVGLAWLAEDDRRETSPWLVVGAVGEGCIKEK